MSERRARARITLRGSGGRRLWALVILAAVGLAVPAAWVVWFGRRASPRPSPPRSLHPPGIVIHHSATPGVVAGSKVGAAQIDRWHKRRGFGIRYRGKQYHIGYHYVIRADGKVEAGRPEHCPGAHAKWTEFNRYLGICLVGHFSQARNRRRWEPAAPTPAQLRALVALSARLMEKYQIPLERVLRHCDVRETACPGDRFPYARFLEELDRYRRTRQGPQRFRISQEP